MFSFVEGGFNSKKGLKQVVHEEETVHLLEQENQDAVVIKTEKKKGDVVMQNEWNRFMCEIDLKRLHSGLQFVMKAFRAVRDASS